MKKFAIILAVLLVLPVSAMALTPMSDSSLEDVTGQSGVSISVNDIVFDIAITSAAWGDGDGLDSANVSTENGWISFNGIKMLNVQIDKLIDYTDKNSNGSDDLINTGSLNPLGYDKLTFDVVTYEDAATLGAYLSTTDTFHAVYAGALAASNTGDTYLRIGLPTVRIYMEEFIVDSISLVASSVFESTTPAAGLKSNRGLNGSRTEAVTREDLYRVPKSDDVLGSFKMFDFTMDFRGPGGIPGSQADISIFAH